MTQRYTQFAAVAAAALLTACGGGNDPAAEAPATEIAAADQGVEVQPMAALTTLTKQVGVSGRMTSIGQSPADVRARYGFDAFQTPAQQGSGQVIAVISAYNNPNIVADLQRFSAQHGLPGCTQVKTEYRLNANGYGEADVVRPAAGSGCSIQVVNVDSLGRPNYGPRGCEVWGGVDPFTRQKMCVKAKYSEIVPQADMSGAWIAESSMDVQWAHAIAPMATIVVVQTPTPFVSGLAYAVKYASSIANVVSMSWGGREQAFTSTCPTGYGGVLKDPTCTTYKQTAKVLYGATETGYGGGWDTIAFSNPNVTYVAASGDYGAVPMWPSVSNRVLAVGGTNDSGAVDTAWSGSGGGMAAYYPAPAFQAGLGQATRSVPDVAYNADSRTPFSVYVTPAPWMPDTACVKANGAANCGWYGGYGTSAGAPQWTGLVAISRAMRAEQGRNVIDYLTGLYAVAGNPAQYADAFGDVTTGSNGYTAKTGYDLVTGLGVPRAGALIGFLNDL